MELTVLHWFKFFISLTTSFSPEIQIIKLKQDIDKPDFGRK